MELHLSISVVIPTKNRCSDLTRCLDSLLAQSVKPAEIIVVDNESSDDTVFLNEKYPEVRFLRNHVPNIPRSLNLGWQFTRSDYIAFLNDDTQVPSTWIEELSHWLSILSDFGAMGGPTIDMRRRVQAELLHKKSFWLLFYDKFMMDSELLEFGRLNEWGGYSIGNEYPSVPTQVQTLTVTNMMIKRNLLEELNGFDEDFNFSNYDGMLFILMNRLKKKMYFIPITPVLHFVNPLGSTRSPYFLARDYAIFYSKLMPMTLQERMKLRFNELFFVLSWLLRSDSDRCRVFLSAIQGFLSGIDYIRRKSTMNTIEKQ